MRFDIRHVTQYQYDEPVRESVMELWMQPRGGIGQRLIDFDLEIDPHAQVFSYPDSWGNTVRHFDVPHPHSKLTITARSTVETATISEPPAALTPEEWNRLKADTTRSESWDFLHPHGYARHTEALTAFCEKHGIGALTDLDPMSATRELNSIIFRALDYESGITAADSPIDEALGAGRGVCQDFAHIMIAILRGWGVPARYVSGYVATDAGGSDRSRPDASHAWVEVLFPSLRWIGFDPTNNVLAGERHIVVAIGRDYADVPPSRGVFKGDAESHLSVGVSVRPSQSGDPGLLQLGLESITARRRRASGTGQMDQHHQQQQ